MHYSDKYADMVKSGLIVYEPETGKFFTKDLKERRTKVDHKGYLKFSANGYGMVLAHRAAWAIYYGQLPHQHIDHIDGDKQNNRITNLRLCTHNQNQHNQGIRKTNKSGFKGVSFTKALNKWQAQICCNSKVKHLGFYECKVEAAHAYDIAAMEFHGEFAWTNFPKEFYSGEAGYRNSKDSVTAR
ncbi:HNH endonuclease [Citrobacter freundii]|uniref:HNH endonuclease n=1 Tax=Citrobacter freundii TaxID=546 RepID=UPI0017867FAA|nr:HNH endonuclease [Citrobacter freundii]MBD5703291.1 HNH endonuclease [Citrobacter freundii]